MMTKKCFSVAVQIFVSVTLLTIAGVAQASCPSEGKGVQTVRLSTEGMNDFRWRPSAGEIKPVALPNGFKLGLRIEPATAEKYREWLQRSGDKAMGEMVRIELFDLSGAESKLLSNTWGGANSRQGFGPKGGANGVPAMGQQVSLWFHKPVCVTAEMLAAMR